MGGQYWDAEMRDGLLPQPTKFTQISAFIEDEWRFRDDLALTVGVRHDDHDTFGGYTTPRAYLVWNASDNWTFKGGASGGYKAPRLEYLTNGIYTVSGQGRSPNIGNPDLEPETSVSTEVGAIYDNMNGMSAGLTIFQSKYKDFINTSDGPIALSCNTGTNEAACEAFLASFGSIWDMGYRNYPLNTGVADSFTLRRPVNLDKAKIQGAELFGRMRINEQWSIAGNYTYTESKQQSGVNIGKPINDTPDHMANFLVRYKPMQNLSTWGRVEYRSDGYRSGTTSGVPSRDLAGDWKGYSLLHVGGIYNVNKSLSLAATVFNVFDKRFNEATVVNGTTFATYRNNQDPRRLVLTANYTF